MSPFYEKSNLLSMWKLKKKTINSCQINKIRWLWNKKQYADERVGHEGCKKEEDEMPFDSIC